MIWICFPSNVLVSKTTWCFFFAFASLGVDRQPKTPPNSWTLNSFRNAVELQKASAAAVETRSCGTVSVYLPAFASLWNRKGRGGVLSAGQRVTHCSDLTGCWPLTPVLALQNVVEPGRPSGFDSSSTTSCVTMVSSLTPLCLISPRCQAGIQSYLFPGASCKNTMSQWCEVCSWRLSTLSLW